ncbi:MAG: hypothetical protein A3E83_08030 [Gammaproteobacteria bacterium RIFCSPHIGHO2_12_FULL_41_20]|nr:MAG: hypothetical protein A3E83_08030 [Gammaproteobacteria bacterium RIFCSPHIGHO2_12_FULL_41_20]
MRNNINNLVDKLTYINLPRSIIKITGKDAKLFLQGQVTCDLNAASPQTSLLGAHCNPQGRIVFLFRLIQCDEDYYLFLPTEILTIALHSLKKYAVFYKVQLTPLDTVTTIGLWGEQANAFLSTSALSINTIATDAVIHCNKAIVVPLASSKLRYLVIGNPANTLIQKITTMATLASLQQWQYLDILAGLPTIYPETTEKFLPHDINLHQINGISFQKGCYTGQEIIARMHYKGKLKNHLYHAQLITTANLAAGTELYNSPSQDATWSATIVNIIQEKNNFYLALLTANTTLIEQNQLFANKEKVRIHQVLNL